MGRIKGRSAKETETRLKEAAARLFAQRGYGAVSMRELAGEVGVGAGALYRHTPDKQALLFDILETHALALVNAARPLAKLENGLPDFVRLHVLYHQEHPHALTLAQRETRSLLPENQHRILRLRRDYEMILARILMKRGLGPQPAVLAMRALLGMLAGSGEGHHRGPDQTAEDLAERLVPLAEGLVSRA